MPGNFQSANDRDPDGVTLDRLPPGPPDKKGSARVGMGEMGGSPGLMALNGMEMIENGMQLMQTAMPQLNPLIQPMAMLLAQLRQAVPQALAGGGTQSALLAPPPMAAMPGGPGPQMGGGMVPPSPPQAMGQ